MSLNLKNAILDKMTTMKDGSLKITLVTRELAPDQMAKLFLSLNQEIMSVDIPTDISEEPKSKAQRLRAVLYKLWEQSWKDRFQTFSLYYDHIMEQLINNYKDKLE